MNSTCLPCQHISCKHIRKIWMNKFQWKTKLKVLGSIKISCELWEAIKRLLCHITMKIWSGSGKVTMNNLYILCVVDS